MKSRRGSMAAAMLMGLAYAGNSHVPNLDKEVDGLLEKQRPCLNGCGTMTSHKKGCCSAECYKEWKQ